MYDLIIQNALIYDGSGQPPFSGDVAVSDSRIAGVEPPGVFALDSAGETIDAGGLCLSPGFIDVHSHSDYYLLICPSAESKLRQGVTTEVIGQCGMSGFPLTGLNRTEEQMGVNGLGLDLDWSTLEQFREKLEEIRPSINVVAMVGHGMVRSAVMGYEKRSPCGDELEAMKNLVAQAMDEGASGFSSGLQYPPGRYGDTREVAELARVAGEKGGFYATHIRNEADHLIQSIDETIRIGGQASVPVMISHLKASGRPNWGKAGQAITQIEKGRHRGVDVTFDRYPYLASSTCLDVYMPGWAQAGGREKLTGRLRSGDRELIDAYRKMVETQTAWDRILIVDLAMPDSKHLVGKSIAQVAEEQGQEPCRVAIDLLIETRCHVEMCNFSMCEEDTDRVLAHPLCMIGSDAALASPDGPLGKRRPHPRAYGTFPRFLSEYVRTKKLITLEEAVRRMCGLPAETLGLKDRGRIKKGFMADLVLFKWDSVEDNSRFGDPHHYPSGIDYVFVNGRAVISQGWHTDARPGCFLKRNC